MDASEKCTKSAIQPSQVRAARALVGWSFDRLAAESGVARRTLVRFEAGEAGVKPATIETIRTTLEQAGISFIPENGGGHGVRFQKEPE